jgi:hypothetical protein
MAGFTFSVTMSFRCATTRAGVFVEDDAAIVRPLVTRWNSILWCLEQVGEAVGQLARF